ncbi:GNAT family N-acetyltransferase [Cohnella endophytica]|uniref:GNAT family N-acetyltransferase n=1 Tax=Cohnella endophytica TaxID=2419778 RepID=A0A494XIF0_9BACL|nr:GNAT family N-acetyltransferase [Cohnella endophytica]RKP47959.1 GNAT family N-acetyltransferase [Cohnella endophytica]
MNIEIQQAGILQKPIMENLMALFLHDLSEFADDIKVDDMGMHRFDVMDLFFEKEGLTPYLVRLDGEITGCILIQSGQYTNPEHADYVLNSFFILKRYRRRGIGMAVAGRLFSQYPGRYCCAQLKSNVPAVRFWKKVYAERLLDVFEIEREEDGNAILEQFFAV